MISEQAREHLEQARQWYDDTGVAGRGPEGTDESCVVTALVHALDPEWGQVRGNQIYDEMSRAYARHIGDIDPSFVIGGDVETVLHTIIADRLMKWHDDPVRTKTEVMDVFTKAIND